MFKNGVFCSFVLIFCFLGDIYAGQAGSSEKRHEVNNSGENGTELTQEELNLLSKIVSNKKLMTMAAQIGANSINANNSRKSVENLENGGVAQNGPILADLSPKTCGNGQMPQNLYININADNSLNNTSQNTNNLESNIHISLVQQLYNLIKLYSKKTGSFLWDHKYKILIIIIAIIVAVLIYKLIILKGLLTAPSCLTNCWQAGKSMADIIASNCNPEQAKLLTENLLKTACQNCSSPEALKNCSIVIQEFMKKCAAEEAALKAYATICGALACLKISFLFPVDQNILDEQKERLEKLNLMQKLMNNLVSKCCESQFNFA